MRGKRESRTGRQTERETWRERDSGFKSTVGQMEVGLEGDQVYKKKTKKKQGV